MKLIYLLIELSLAYKLTTSAKIYEIDGHRYYFSHPLKLNWYASQRFCSFHEMNLIDIPSEAENLRILDITTTFFGNQSTDGVYIWTSGTHLGTKGQYFWQTSGKPVFYETWYPGEPNNGCNREDCLVLNGNHKFLWNVVDCMIDGYFICRDFNNTVSITRTIPKPYAQIDSSKEVEFKNQVEIGKFNKETTTKPFVQLVSSDKDNFEIDQRSTFVQPDKYKSNFFKWGM